MSLQLHFSGSFEVADFRWFHMIRLDQFVHPGIHFLEQERSLKLKNVRTIRVCGLDRLQELSGHCEILSPQSQLKVDSRHGHKFGDVNSGVTCGVACATQSPAS